MHSLVCRAFSMIDFCLCTSNFLWCKDTKPRRLGYTTFLDKMFLECPTLHNLAQLLIRRFKLVACRQKSLHSFTPLLLSYTVSSRPSCAILLTHQLSSCRSAQSPHFPALRPALVVFVPSTRQAVPYMHPSPQCYLNPFTSIFTLPTSFQGSSFLPDKTWMCLLEAVFPDAFSRVSLMQNIWKSPIPQLPKHRPCSGHSTKRKRVFFDQLLVLCHSSPLLSIGELRPNAYLFLVLTKTWFSL